MTSSVPGIEAKRLDEWFAANVPGCRPPLKFELIAGGHSNLTYLVGDSDGREWVLRRPPLGEILPTAHDMAREYRILSALCPTSVPVPQPIALSRDPEVIGAPFYVMARVNGEVLRDTAIAEAVLDSGGRRSAGLLLADTLATIHSLVPAAVGLGDLGRPDGYVSRQLRRWKRQLDDSRTRALDMLYELHDRLADRIPEQRYPGLVHGDFRLDNCILGADGAVRAVLDWELCTQGETLADVGMLMVYWPSREDQIQPIAQSPALAAGFPSRQEMLDRYAATRGIKLNDIDFYMAFAYWRLACITEGVYARYLHGGMGDRAGDGAQFEQQVTDLAGAAALIADAW
jgi:aminoglycoside phosphotransferase (APT) family kinase protein